jgi:hypothetical protein
LNCQLSKPFDYTAIQRGIFAYLGHEVGNLPWHAVEYSNIEGGSHFAIEAFRIFTHQFLKCEATMLP